MRLNTLAAWSLAVAAGIALAGAGAGCGKKSKSSGPTPEVTGLAAVPANAEVVIGANVAKLADSPLVERAVAQLLLHDAQLAASWNQVREGCKIELTKQVRHVMLALGPTPVGGRAGTGPALLVAVGSIPENDLSDCVGKLVGKGGGSVTGKAVAGRTVYQVKDGNRTMFFAYGRPDTVVLGTTEAYVVEALGAGSKAPYHPELAAWLKLVDQNLPVWAVGRVDPRVRQGLVGVLPDLKAGPTAFVGSIDPTDGLRLELGAVMASDSDAKQLESITNDQKKLVAMAAQARSLGKLVSKVTIQTGNNIVWFRAPLTMADFNDLLLALDGKGPAAQDSPPPKEAP
jgi:hypothetical protein